MSPMLLYTAINSCLFLGVAYLTYRTVVEFEAREAALQDEIFELYRIMHKYEEATHEGLPNARTGTRRADRQDLCDRA